MSLQLTRQQIVDRLAAFDVRQIDHGEHRAAAVVLAIASVDGVLGIWLTKRNPKLRAHSGQWALPGGRVDEGESVIEAGLRELDEELGIALGPDAVLGELDDFQTRSGYVISPIVAWCGDNPQLRVNEAEVARLEHVSFEDLMVDPIFITIPESDRPVIQLPLCGSLIHAPTAALMYQFREVVLADRATRVADLEQPVFAWK
ncbi:NUDIX domain-containing protein [Epidermidibacterium keratini]|uniref:NUDIX domain-containing protein n=1 Tax=Epidermidibacterium keratini TaxID=1891644 RepID=A0A7L4YR30_9ACTN|nr:CoA pyrophosphatase [Epidermidibacterium keratini]QHC01239.1 NUDIX domain-containing protein [Epidermidibacterium keratini]